MAAIHLASCDLVAFLRTFDRLQRTLFLHQSFHFSNHEHWLESGSNRPTPARQCIPCLEKMFSISYASNLVFRCLYPLNVKVESALFAARPLMRGARQLAVAVAVRRLVSVRRRGKSFSHIYGDDGISCTIPASPYLSSPFSCEHAKYS